MKRIFLSLSFAILALISYAGEVSLQTAQTVAAHFISRKGANPSNLQLSQSYASSAASGQTALYIFDLNESKGFVIVSGDDAVIPILAYSTENHFPAQVTNKEVAYWLKGYTDQISYVIANQLSPSEEVAAAWNSLLNITTQEENHYAAKPTGVAPMLNTNWDQMNSSGSNTLLYNNLCPSGTPTGCVATAMAQIMNFWQHPAMGSGSHSYNTSSQGGTLSADFNTAYDWEIMPAQLSFNSTTAQKEAVALLMFHCGVAVEMDYDYGGSGAYVINYGYPNFPCSQNAMKTYFGYDDDIKGLKRSSYNQNVWITKLKTELDEGRPILYTGYGDLGGHAFVFDGYDDDASPTYFHINWGWSGNSDGYFAISDLAPAALGVGGGGGNFNYNQEALIGIKPAAITPKLTINSEMTLSQQSIDPGAAFSLNVNLKNTGTGDLTDGLLTCGVYVGTNVVGYLETLSDQNLLTGESMQVTFSTPGIAEMIPGTYTIKVLYKTNASELNWKPVSNGSIVNSVSIEVNGTSGVEHLGDNKQILIFPNPATSTVKIDWSNFNGKVTGVQIVNLLGQQVYQNHSINESSLNIPVTGWSAGIYFMNVTTNQGSFSRKIAVQ